MKTVKEVLPTLEDGDVFEAGQILSFSDEPIVWVVMDIVEDIGSRDIYVQAFYYDMFLKEICFSVEDENDKA